MTRCVSANFAPQIAPSHASVAQWIEQRFPKPQVAGSIPAGGAIGITGFPSVGLDSYVATTFRGLRTATSVYALSRSCVGSVSGRSITTKSQRPPTSSGRRPLMDLFCLGSAAEESDCGLQLGIGTSGAFEAVGRTSLVGFPRLLAGFPSGIREPECEVLPAIRMRSCEDLLEHRVPVGRVRSWS